MTSGAAWTWRSKYMAPPLTRAGVRATAVALGATAGTVTEGLELATDALFGVLEGVSVGKALVRLNPDTA
jgi:hypothetical protein